MSSPNPTIYDVAKAAGVSIATVSRVLNYPRKVNATTRAAVMQAIDALGYIPKAESRARALMETRRIGVIIPFFTVPSFVQRLRGIAAVLNKNDYEMVIYPVDSRSREKSYLETLPIRKTLDGLIIVSQVFDESVSHRLIENRMEAVLIEFFEQNFSTLEIDDATGGYMAANYLINKGHRRLAFIGGKEHPEFGVDPIVKRMQGFQKAVKEAGLQVHEDHTYEYVYDPGQMLRNWIAQDSNPLAIFAATDLQAIALIREARVMGLKVPEDLAIIGFDNIDMAEYFGLTTVHQPLDESGKIAANLLISRLMDPSQSIQHIQLPLKIIERETA